MTQRKRIYFYPSNEVYDWLISLKPYSRGRTIAQIIKAHMENESASKKKSHVEIPLSQTQFVDPTSSVFDRLRNRGYL